MVRPEYVHAQKASNTTDEKGTARPVVGCCPRDVADDCLHFIGNVVNFLACIFMVEIMKKEQIFKTKILYICSFLVMSLEL